ncbi:MAG: hypothetical protein CVU29_10620 [Betaproteobacteria bacterium HGW-Betaproteobacteria-22]|nr:MAG: hypothetical protein CVU29_10620 [Betaproteobacteria bacterium HGW-Betaproteobacteria-22]
MIEVAGISKSFYQKKWIKAIQTPALKKVAFTAADGAITALLGPNGAGKTTLLRILAGLETASEGDAKINQHGCHCMHSDLGFLSDGCALYPRLTGYENIQYFARLHAIAAPRMAENLLKLTEALDLKPLLNQRAEQYSQGEKMRINLARALIHHPQTIILDEPTNGLDLVSVRRLRNFLKYLASPEGGGHCILISSHVMSEVQKLADTVVVLSAGEVKARGTPLELCNQAGNTDFEEAFVSLAGLAS